MSYKIFTYIKLGDWYTCPKCGTTFQSNKLGYLSATCTKCGEWFTLITQGKEETKNEQD